MDLSIILLHFLLNLSRSRLLLSRFDFFILKGTLGHYSVRPAEVSVNLKLNRVSDKKNHPTEGKQEQGLLEGHWLHHSESKVQMCPSSG